MGGVNSRVFEFNSRSDASLFKQSTTAANVYTSLTPTQALKIDCLGVGSLPGYYCVGKK